MANKHYDINDEMEITIKIKVSNIKISTYKQLSEEDIKDHIQDFKDNISEHLKYEITKEDYFQQEVTDGVDWWSYSTE
jgi:hypothetical protein